MNDLQGIDGKRSWVRGKPGGLGGWRLKPPSSALRREPGFGPSRGRGLSLQHTPKGRAGPEDWRRPSKALRVLG